jgi:hypothetical protein
MRQFASIRLHASKRRKAALCGKSVTTQRSPTCWLGWTTLGIIIARLIAPLPTISFMQALSGPITIGISEAMRHLIARIEHHSNKSNCGHGSYAEINPSDCHGRCAYDIWFSVRAKQKMEKLEWVYDLLPASSLRRAKYHKP